MKSLKLAQNLSLPVDVVTQTIAILAKRRAGKSYTMRRLAEQLFTAGQQIVLIDPKGDQWGIRSSADGKGPGLSVIILGGERGDVPLEVQGGELVAKLVVEERVSVVLDLSGFRKREVATFMADFLENVYRLKAREVHRTPMMLVVDEADAIAPQKPQPGEERMLGAIEDIVRRGGQRGIGCTMVTQRSAVLNKNVLTQAQILVALQTIAPQDLKAMREWIDVHGTPAERDELMASLPALPVGDAWFWSPGWPTAAGVFQRVHVLPIETFDSGATPKPGERRVEPKRAADVDIESLKRQMADVVERKRADDPRELRKQLADLQRELEQKAREAGAKLAATTPVLTEDDRALLRGLAAHMLDLKGALLRLPETTGLEGAVTAALQAVLISVERDQAEAREHFMKLLDGKRFGSILAKLEGVSVAPPAVQSRASYAPEKPSAPPAAPRVVGTGEGTVSGGERKILTVLAQYPTGRAKTQIALLTGYAHSGGGFNNYLSALRSKGYITTGDPMRITQQGLEALGAYTPLPTGVALRTYWLGQVGKAERLILQALVDVWPKALTKEDVATKAGYEASGGGFNNALSRLRSLELISGRGELKASDDLFE